MKRPEWVWVVLLACALATLAGCGGDDDADDDALSDESDEHDGGGRDAAASADASAHGDAGSSTTHAGPGTWAGLGYDTKSNYFNPDETAISVDNAADLTEKWVFTVSGYPAGGVAIAEGKVFATATGGLYAIDLETGDELWHRTDLAAQSTVAYVDGFLYVHTMAANLFKIKAEDGSDVWGPVKTYDHPAADGTSSVVVAGGKVLVGHSTSAEVTQAMQAEARGGVFAADAETGEELWHYYTVELPENGAMIWSTVSVDLERGVVYAGAGNNYTMAGGHSDSIHAIDLETGEQLWVTQVRQGDVWSIPSAIGGPDTDFGANPILATVDGQDIVAAGDKGSAFWALDRETGDILWSHEDLSASHTPANGGVLNNGAFDGERFYVASNQPRGPGLSMLHALNPADGTEAWDPIMLDKVVWGMLSVANGVLFVPTGDELRLYNAATGELLNMFATGGTIAAGPAAIAGGRVVVKSGLTYPLDSTVMANNQIHCYGP